MYGLYRKDKSTGDKIGLGFSETTVYAKKKLVELANEYIVQKQGTDRLKDQNLYQEAKFDPSKLSDGMYIVKEETRVSIYRKLTTNVTVTGYVWNSSDIKHTAELVCYFEFIEWPATTFNEFIGREGSKVPTKQIVKDERKTAIVDDLIERLAAISTGKYKLKKVPEQKKQPKQNVTEQVTLKPLRKDAKADPKPLIKQD